MLRHATVSADPESIMSSESNQIKNSTVSDSINNEAKEFNIKELGYINKYIIFGITKIFYDGFTALNVKTFNMYKVLDLTVCE